jgi:hypothetical protein
MMLVKTLAGDKCGLRRHRSKIPLVTLARAVSVGWMGEKPARLAEKKMGQGEEMVMKGRQR